MKNQIHICAVHINSPVYKVGQSLAVHSILYNANNQLCFQYSHN